MSVTGYESKKAFLKRLTEETESMLAAMIKPDEILEYYDEEYKVWKADRIYRIHNSEPLDIYMEKPGAKSGIENCIKSIDEQLDGYLGSIENEKLYHALRGLKVDDLALVEACVIKGVPQKEYAARIGRSNSTVNERLKRILNLLKTMSE